jgi:hypothetical protein
MPTEPFPATGPEKHEANSNPTPKSGKTTRFKQLLIIISSPCGLSRRQYFRHKTGSMLGHSNKSVKAFFAGNGGMRVSKTLPQTGRDLPTFRFSP